MYLCVKKSEKSENYLAFGLRATTSVLTSGKEKKYVMTPSKLNLAVTREKLGIYTLHNTPEVLRKLAPPEAKRSVLWYVLS